MRNVILSTIVSLSALTGCTASQSVMPPPPPLAPEKPLTVLAYAEDNDYRTRDVVRSIQRQVSSRADLTHPRRSASLTLALSRNVLLPESYGPDAFSITVRVLVNGVTRDRFGSQCARPRDPECASSILRYSMERHRIISAQLAEQYPDES